MYNTPIKKLDSSFAVVLGFSGLLAITGIILRFLGLTTPQPMNDAEMIARIMEDRIELIGKVPDGTTQAALLSQAATAFADRVGDSGLSVDGNVKAFTGNPMEVLRYYLEIGNDLNQSQIYLKGGTVRLDGSTDSEEKRTRFEQGAIERFPDLVVDNAIVVESSLQADINQFLEGKLIEFASGSDQLLETAWPILNDVAAMIRSAGGNAAIEVQGHTDGQGDPASNQDLSERRAASVCRYLFAQGVSEGMLTPKGFGASVPVADNSTAEGRQANRRVVFIVR